MRLPGKVFFSNSGAESNELAYKIAQRFGLKHEGKTEIITFNGSFHGRTLGGISATAQGKIKDGFGPFVPGFKHLPFNDIEALKNAVGPQTSAILLEPIQGESGINPATVEFLRAARDLCREHNALLMLDEVQCGLGRTGDYRAWYSLGATDVEPDVVTWAKGLAGGMPLGAVWISKRPVRLPEGEVPVCDIITPGSHGTTYGGSPVVTAGAVAVFEEIEEKNLLQNARDRGEELFQALNAIENPVLKEVRGKGLMIGLQFAEDFWEHIPERIATEQDRAMPPSKWMVLELAKMGLLVIPAGTHVLRLLPPLNVAPEEVRHAANLLTDFMENLK
jgi:acetylornithine/succinyldiaminopimelate/putrescine aminotransferase